MPFRIPKNYDATEADPQAPSQDDLRKYRQFLEGELREVMGLVHEAKEVVPEPPTPPWPKFELADGGPAKIYKFLKEFGRPATSRQIQDETGFGQPYVGAILNGNKAFSKVPGIHYPTQWMINPDWKGS